MEVLKAICTNGEDLFKDDPDYLDDLPLKFVCNKADPIKIEDSDSEDEGDQKRRRFGSHIASFQFGTKDDVKVTHDDEKRSTAIASIRKSISLSPEFGFKKPLVKKVEVKQLLPDLCESMMPMLRGFPNCPLCLQPFPILSANEGAEAIAAKSKKKKVIVRYAVTGAARLQHVRICACRMHITSDVVTSLVKREKIRLDRNTRQEYSEKVNNQPLWKTLTGDEPPNTQAQIAATTRKRKNQKAVEEAAAATTPAKKSKAKASASTSSPAVFKAGKRGGLSRASTTILSPKSTRAEVKSNCCVLFGLPEVTVKAESYNDILNDYLQMEEGTARSRKAAKGGYLFLGLGVGVCSKERIDSTVESSPRLSMGYSLGSVMAQRYKASY